MNEKVLGYGKIALFIILPVALGLIAINQFIQFQYYNTLLGNPCDLCKQYNQNQSVCIEGCFTKQDTLFAQPSGFRDLQGNCYDDSKKQIPCFNINISR